MMPVVISPNIGSPEPDLRHTRIGYRSIWRKGGASVVASSAQELFPASSAANELTTEFWRPQAMPATWEADAGVESLVNYCGIGAHTLGGLRDMEGNEVQAAVSVVEVQFFDESAQAWETIDSHAPLDNAPIMFLFEDVAAQRFRVRIDGVDVPSVGVIFFGITLDVERRIYGNHSPVQLARRTVREPQTTERGQWAGLTVIRQGAETDFQWRNLTPGFVRDYFDPFVAYATQGRGGFFIAWRAAFDEEAVAYGWVSDDDIVPQNSGTRDLMDVSFTLRGQVQFDPPISEDFS